MTICESEVETNNAVKPVTYIAFEIPASLVLKKLRASRLIPFFIILFNNTSSFLFIHKITRNGFVCTVHSYAF